MIARLARLTLMALCLLPLEVMALRYTGRLTLGAASSTEQFKSTDFGSARNDALYSSQRFYLKFSDLTDSKWETVLDLRNKYDSFDKLNKEQYQLDAKDEFQIRQVSAHMHNPEGSFVPTLGRFNIPEAGAVFVDGVDMGWRFSERLRSGVFGGMNPKNIEKSYLESDPKASGGGLYLTYQDQDDGWEKNFYLTHALVQQRYDGKTERQFFFHNLIYQWQADSRVISLLYYDMVEKAKIQTADFSYQQKISSQLSSDLGHLEIDVIEYRRRQGVLEKLSPSPYKESHAGIDFRMTRDTTWGLEARQGQRYSDSLKMTSVDLSLRVQNLGSRNWDTKFKLMSKKNFVSQDSGSGWNIGYFSNHYEAVLDSDYTIQKNDDGTTTHPMNLELSLTSYISKTYFVTASLQRASDENVTILGAFFKLGYRFGNTELPPIRDGAAPRGSL